MHSMYLRQNLKSIILSLYPDNSRRQILHLVPNVVLSMYGNTFIARAIIYINIHKLYIGCVWYLFNGRLDIDRCFYAKFV